MGPGGGEGGGKTRDQGDEGQVPVPVQQLALPGGASLPSLSLAIGPQLGTASQAGGGTGGGRAFTQPAESRQLQQEGRQEGGGVLLGLPSQAMRSAVAAPNYGRCLCA